MESLSTQPRTISTWYGIWPQQWDAPQTDAHVYTKGGRTQHKSITGACCWLPGAGTCSRLEQTDRQGWAACQPGAAAAARVAVALWHSFTLSSASFVSKRSLMNSWACSSCACGTRAPSSSSSSGHTSRDQTGLSTLTLVWCHRRQGALSARWLRPPCVSIAAAAATHHFAAGLLVVLYDTLEAHVGRDDQPPCRRNHVQQVQRVASLCRGMQQQTSAEHLCAALLLHVRAGLHAALRVPSCCCAGDCSNVWAC